MRQGNNWGDRAFILIHILWRKIYIFVQIVQPKENP